MILIDNYINIRKIKTIHRIFLLQVLILVSHVTQVGMLAQKDIYIHTQTHPLTHSLLHIHAYIVQTQILNHIHTQKQTNEQNTQPNTHTNTHKHTHAHTYKHTHTYCVRRSDGTLNRGLVCVAHQTWTIKIPTSLRKRIYDCRLIHNCKHLRVWALHVSCRVNRRGFTPEVQKGIINE